MPGFVEDVAQVTAAHEPLFSHDDARNYRSQWERVQASFVDEPRQAVAAADELVEQTIKHLAEVFTGQRSTLEQEWGKNEQVSTEDLRQALRKYRSFFDRLLSV